MCVAAPDEAIGRATPVRGLLRWQFRLAHKLMEATIQQQADALHRRPAGDTASAGACYTQAVLYEDLTVNGVLAARPPLAFSTWAGRTGLSEPPSLVGPPGEPPCWRAWARRVRLDLPAFRAYANAVYAATDAYLAALPDDDLALPSTLSPACLLSALLLTASARRGEIASLLARDRASTPTDLLQTPHP